MLLSFEISQSEARREISWRENRAEGGSVWHGVLWFVMWPQAIKLRFLLYLPAELLTVSEAHTERNIPIEAVSKAWALCNDIRAL